MATRKSGVADLGLNYDIGGESIFAPNQNINDDMIEDYLNYIIRGR